MLFSYNARYCRRFHHNAFFRLLTFPGFCSLSIWSSEEGECFSRLLPDRRRSRACLLPFILPRRRIISRLRATACVAVYEPFSVILVWNVRKIGIAEILELLIKRCWMSTSLCTGDNTVVVCLTHAQNLQMAVCEFLINSSNRASFIASAIDKRHFALLLRNQVSVQQRNARTSGNIRRSPLLFPQVQVSYWFRWHVVPGNTLNFVSQCVVDKSKAETTPPAWWIWYWSMLSGLFPLLSVITHWCVFDHRSQETTWDGQIGRWIFVGQSCPNHHSVLCCA